uniref:Uncharacterized protein n=1 Tax=Chenopodium quinoa TaxID=63459 RepID=A0A803MTY1_CHEQI
MALVQSLTGISSTKNKEFTPNNLADDRSVSTSESSSASDDSRHANSYKLLSSSSAMDLNQPEFTCMRDIPLYTPTGLELLN